MEAHPCLPGMDAAWEPEADSPLREPAATPAAQGIDPAQPRKGEGPRTAAWRRRMGTPEAKEIYKERAATIEAVNADLKAWRGLSRLNVR